MVTNDPAYMRNWKENNGDRVRELSRNSTVNIKLEFVAEYGGKCVCCGESDPRFLTVDHINGRKDEEKRRTGATLLSWLRFRGWPKDNYQLYCYNCNCGKGAYGVCPHTLPLMEPIRKVRTECHRGHPYDEENTYFYGGGLFRQCRACAKLRYRRKKGDPS